MKEFNEALCALDRAERLLVEARIQIGKAWSKNEPANCKHTGASRQTVDAVMSAAFLYAKAVEKSQGFSESSEAHAAMIAARESLREMVIRNAR